MGEDKVREYKEKVKRLKEENKRLRDLLSESEENFKSKID